MVGRDALIVIRHDLGPGDVGEITMLHAEVYTAEFGWDHRFEGYVARTLGEFAERQPHERERIWIAEADGGIVGCIAIVDAGSDVAQLRWYLVDPHVRGRGLGRRLIEEAIAFTKEAGYRSVFLWTTSELRVAAHLYRSAGFALVESVTRQSWGRPVVEERYVLSLERLH